MSGSSSLRDSDPALRLLSLGAGVQSTAVLLLACDGVIPAFDYALFADTRWEPRAVYSNLARLADHAERKGIPVRTVSAGDIRADALDPRHRFVSMPLHVRNPDGSKGLARRQCTSEYKVRPLKMAARQLLGYPHPRRVPRGVFAEQAIGISTDELARAKDADVAYLRNVFPLLELGWDRARCIEYLAHRGFGDTVKSACVGCPFTATPAGIGSETTTLTAGPKPWSSTRPSGTAIHMRPSKASLCAASTSCTAPAGRWTRSTSNHAPRRGRNFDSLVLMLRRKPTPRGARHGRAALARQ